MFGRTLRKLLTVYISSHFGYSRNINVREEKECSAHTKAALVRSADLATTAATIVVNTRITSPKWPVSAGIRSVPVPGS